MANETSLRLLLSATKNGVSVGGDVSLSITMSGDRMMGNTQAIGTSAEAINFVDVVPAYVLLINRDTVNYVDIAIDNAAAAPFSKLEAGKATLFPTKSGAVYYAKANTAACNLQVVAVDA